MNKIPLLVSLISLHLTNSYGQFIEKNKSFSNNYSKIEKHIIDIIANLPEVRKRSYYVKSQTKNKRHIRIVIWQKPTIEHKYYWVKVMEDNGMSYYTHFNFFIYPKNFSIKYFDTSNDTELTLENWRKSSNYK